MIHIYIYIYHIYIYTWLMKLTNHLQTTVGRTCIVSYCYYGSNRQEQLVFVQHFVLGKLDGTDGTNHFATVKMAIEIVDLSIKNGDFPWFFVSLPEGTVELVSIAS